MGHCVLWRVVFSAVHRVRVWRVPDVFTVRDDLE
jgi:hypothetical protein